MRRSLTLVTILAVLLAAAGVAEAAPSRKKSIWGPVQVNDVSQFPIYADLGAGLYQMNLRWDIAAPRRPQRPADPADPAYRWPPEVDYALSEAQKFGIQVSLLVVGAPSWANGRRPRNWAPLRAADFASFVSAAARRYPAVRHWMIWGEPSRREMFMLMACVVRVRDQSCRQY